MPWEDRLCNEKTHTILQTTNCSAVKNNLFSVSNFELADCSQILDWSLASNIRQVGFCVYINANS